MQNGEWPEREIDHTDGNPQNNRAENLREATSAQNKANSRSRVGSTSRYKGVSWSKLRKMWEVQIRTKAGRMHLGFFNDESEAATAYDEAAHREHGAFARLNCAPTTIGRLAVEALRRVAQGANPSHRGNPLTSSPTCAQINHR